MAGTQAKKYSREQDDRKRFSHIYFSFQCIAIINYNSNTLCLSTVLLDKLIAKDGVIHEAKEADQYRDR